MTISLDTLTRPYRIGAIRAVVDSWRGAPLSTVPPAVQVVRWLVDLYAVQVCEAEAATKEYLEALGQQHRAEQTADNALFWIDDIAEHLGGLVRRRKGEYACAACGGVFTVICTHEETVDRAGEPRSAVCSDCHDNLMALIEDGQTVIGPDRRVQR